MYSPDLQGQAAPLVQNGWDNNVKCMICYKDFNSTKSNRPDYEISKRIFDNYTRLLKVQLILPMQWNFQYESLPFCSPCTTTVTKLLELNEKFHFIQNEIRVILQKVKIEILKTQDANLKRMMEPLGRRRGTRGSASYLEKVDYFRSFAVKDLDPDVQLNIKNELLKATKNLPAVALSLPKGNEETGFVEDQGASFFEEDDYQSSDTEDVPNSEVAGSLIEIPLNVPRSTKEYAEQFYTKKGENIAQCNLCERPMLAKNINNLKRHFLTLHGKEMCYQCKFCKKMFSAKAEGIDHIRSMHLKKAVGPKKLTGGKKVTSPAKRYIPSADVPVEEILKKVIQLKNGDPTPITQKYKRHYKKVGDNYVCKICTRQVKTIKDIVRHVHACHKGSPNFQCFYCNKKFLERYICVRHLKSAHESELKAEYETLCAAENEGTSEVSSFSSSTKTNELQVYKRIGNSFKCCKCNFTSLYNSSIYRHNKKVHCNSAGRPGIIKFPFAIAKKSKDTKANLKEKSSMEVDSSNNSQTPNTDEGIISNIPANIDQLVKSYIEDRKTVKGKKRFRCNSCAYATSVYTNIRRHIRDCHLKIKPYSCAYCKKEFYTKSKCQLHIILDHSQQSSQSISGTSVSKRGKVKIEPGLNPSNDETNVDSESIVGQDGGLNDSKTLRPKRGFVSYNEEAEEPQNDEEQLCIRLPKSSIYPFSPEFLTKYVSETDAAFCLVCEKHFASMQQHIANVHEEIRNFQCFFCSKTFFYKAKCMRHIKEKCLKQSKKLRLKGDYSSFQAKSMDSSQATVSSTTPKSKPNVAKKKVHFTPPKAQPAKTGVYRDYYDRNGKRITCKICHKRIADYKRLANHFVSMHKDIYPYECNHCDEKFNRKPLLTQHFYNSHPAEAALAAQELEKKLLENAKAKNSLQAEPVGTNISDDIEISPVKAESTWIEFSQPIEEPSDPFLENVESRNETADSPPSPSNENQEMDSNHEEEPATISSVDVVPSREEYSGENEAPKCDYGVITIHQQSNLNCDPFIDKDSVNKCKVCNRSFKLRKLVTDHIKNVHLGVRRYQCEFCNKKYYHLAACKQHVEDNHPADGISQNSQEDSQEMQNSTFSFETVERPSQNTSSRFSSSDLQISNVHSQAPTVHSSEVITLDNSMMAVEEPMSFEPWKELPSSQDKGIEPFFDVLSDHSDEEEEEEEPQFVVQEQNGLGFGSESEMGNFVTDEVSIYDIVGLENIIELAVDRTFSDSIEYTTTEDGNFSCNHCRKEFNSRKSALNHINVKHRQMARFQCKMCEKKYYHKYHVAQHIASIHMKKDIFKCQICEKSYGHSQALKRHYSSVHSGINFNSREQWCQICKLPFQSPQDLISHMSRIHPT